MDDTAVPRAAERLLEAALSGSDLRDSVLGDLEEEFAERARLSRAWQVRAWYWGEAVRMGARFAARRLSRRGVPSPAAEGPRKETPVSSFMSDLRQALRALRKQAGLSAVVAVTLALGLGINATVLGMMDALLLRPFQFRDADRLVVVWEQVRGGSDREQVARANFLDWRAQARSIEQLSAWDWLDATLTGRGGEPERVQGFRVSPGFFELLGITPALGRTFAPDDEQLGNHRRVIIADGLWKRRFGAEPAIIGTDILVDGQPHTVVGIAPQHFSFPVGSELWVPLALTSAQASDRRTRPLTVAGKLPEGQSLATAQAEMTTISSRLASEHPETNAERSASVRPLSTAFREDSTAPFVGILQAAAGLVLLVACANVTGLLLARAMERRRELALRTALGASRSRIVRQLVTETVVLGLAASVLAVVVATVGLDLLRSSVPAETARFVEGWDNLRLDPRFALAIPALAIVVGLAIGLPPALAATRTELTDALKDGERASDGMQRQRARQILVVTEIALTLALLVAAGHTLAGGRRLANAPGGFDSQGLLTLQLPLPDVKYGNADARRHFASTLIDRFEALPLVERAALSNILPASGWNPSSSFVVEHDPDPEPLRRPKTGVRAVSDGYFQTLRIPIVSGRAFSTSDREGRQPVAIVSASLAERFWPGQDPIGRRLRLDGGAGEWLHIVGVASDVKMYNWWDGEDAVAVYVPLRQSPPVGLAYAAIRAHGDPSAIAASVREAVRALDPQLPASNLRSMRDAIVQSSAGLNNLAWMMGVCGGIGLLLALVGIYSVMSYAVSRRMHEFGVRLALGASARDLLRLTLSEAGVLTLSGLAVGALLAIVLGRILSSALFGLITLHPLTFAAISAGMALVSLAAACVPARRALTADPLTVLRGQ